MPLRAPPWPLPLAAGTAAGVAVVLLSASAAWAGPALALVALAAALLVAARAVRASWAGAAALAGTAVLACSGIALGSLRAASWLAQSDPWAEQLDLELVLEGRSDGTVLWVPGRGGLVLRGERVAAGPALVRGRLEALPERRNPGGVDLRAHWRRRGAWAALRVTEVPRTASAPGAREALRRGVVAGLRPEAAALVQAMTLGVRDDLGSLREAFAASGLAHVLALSGLHVGVLALALAAVARPLRRWRPLAVAVGVVAYVAVVGATPSVVRAAVMVGCVLVVLALGVPRPRPLPLLALAAFGSLLVAPGWLGDLGFLLSYGSVAGIVVLAPPLMRLLPRVRFRPLRPVVAALGASLAVSVAAQLATASMVASTFGALPLAAPLANLVAVPLATLLVPLGFGAGLAGLLHDGLARGVNVLVGPVAEALIALARFSARAPSLPWGEIRADGHVAFACALVAVACALHGRLRVLPAALVVLVAIATTAATPSPFPTPELVVLDVGQGDAVVVRLGNGRAVLIDGGGSAFADHDVGARVVVPALRAMGVHALDVVIATHADLDHVGGLPAVLASMPVGELWIGHREDERRAFRAVVDAAAVHGVPVREVRRGLAADLAPGLVGDRGRVRLEVLHPTPQPRLEPNDDSVVVVVRVDGVAWALLAGDVGSAVEAELAVPPLCVLLAPHHGSATSTSDDLLRAAGPVAVLVSVGRNRFGHPHPSVLARIEAAGASVRTTLAEGALRLSFPRPCQASQNRVRAGVLA